MKNTKAQMLRAETYPATRQGKRPGACGLAGEMLRERGYCDHVEKPMLPNVRFCPSTPLSALPALIADLKWQEAKRTGRQMRKNAQLLAGYFISYPHSVKELREDPAKLTGYHQWLARVVKFVQRWHGADDVYGYEHLDEAHPHLHLLLGPYLHPKWGLTIGHRHPGYGVAREAWDAAIDANGGSREGLNLKRVWDAAYKAGIKAYCDDFYETVSKPCGIDRRGEFPRARRPRRVHLAIRAAEQKAEEQRLEVERLRAENERLRAEADRVKGLAKASGIALERRLAPRF